MDTPLPPNPPRLLTATELGAVVKALREQRGWSQEVLAEIAKVNARTIQRVERGEGASADTRRALGVAFTFPDMDFFNKPLLIPTAEEIAAAQAQFDRDYVLAPAEPLESGKMLASLVESTLADQSALTFEAPEAVEAAFATLIDLLRDYRDMADEIPQREKVDVWRAFQEQLDELRHLGVALVWATRDVPLRWNDSEDITQLKTLYLQGFPVASVPSQLGLPLRPHIQF